MGVMIHHAIVINSWDRKHVDVAREHAAEIGCQISDAVEGAINGEWSFLIAPDGSKEGWAESDAGDERRRQMKAWLRAQRYDDGGNAYCWVEVEFTNDYVQEEGEPMAYVVDHEKADRSVGGDEADAKRAESLRIDADGGYRAPPEISE